jgi:hypothetical protein
MTPQPITACSTESQVYRIDGHDLHVDMTAPGLLFKALRIARTSPDPVTFSQKQGQQTSTRIAGGPGHQDGSFGISINVDVFVQ